MISACSASLTATAIVARSPLANAIVATTRASGTARARQTHTSDMHGSPPVPWKYRLSPGSQSMHPDSPVAPLESKPRYETPACDGCKSHRAASNKNELMLGKQQQRFLSTGQGQNQNKGHSADKIIGKRLALRLGGLRERAAHHLVVARFTVAYQPVRWVARVVRASVPGSVRPLAYAAPATWFPDARACATQTRQPIA